MIHFSVKIGLNLFRVMICRRSKWTWKKNINNHCRRLARWTFKKKTPVKKEIMNFLWKVVNNYRELSSMCVCLWAEDSLGNYVLIFYHSSFSHHITYAIKNARKHLQTQSQRNLHFNYKSWASNIHRRNWIIITISQQQQWLAFGNNFHQT